MDDSLNTHLAGIVETRVCAIYSFGARSSLSS